MKLALEGASCSRVCSFPGCGVDQLHFITAISWLNSDTESTLKGLLEPVTLVLSTHERQGGKSLRTSSMGYCQGFSSPLVLPSNLAVTPIQPYPFSSQSWKTKRLESLRSIALFIGSRRRIGRCCSCSWTTWPSRFLPHYWLLFPDPREFWPPQEISVYLSHCYMR